MLKRELKAASFTTHFAAAHETRHLLHHLLALLKLLHKAIDFCNIHTCASGNPVLTGKVQDSWIGTLLWGHGKNNGLGSVHCFLIDHALHIFHLASHTREHVQDTGDSAHLIHLFKAGKIVIEIKIHLLQLLGRRKERRNLLLLLMWRRLIRKKKKLPLKFLSR